MNLDALLAKAKSGPVATPQRHASCHWASLFPVFEALRERGHSYKSAIDWLIAEKAMKAEDKAKAENAFEQLVHRRRKKLAGQKPQPQPQLQPV